MLRKIRRPPLKKKRRDKYVVALSRMDEVVNHLHRIAKTRAGKKVAAEAAKQYLALSRDHMFARILRCVEIAKEKNSWEFMDGCFSQATDIYAVASLSYESFNQEIMPDALFDMLARFLYTNYDNITDYCKEEWNLDRGIFKAGTGLHFTDPSKLAPLAPYYNRLLERHGEKNERKRTADKPRLLRKPAIGGKSIRKIGLRRPAKKP